MGRKGRVGVVVLGDLGRSPRMQYHALSLANSGFQVDLIGYAVTELPEEVKTHANIRVKPVKAVPAALAALPRLPRYFLKSALQALFLLLSLPLFSSLECILVQTPPGVPTLPALWFYCLLKGTRLVVDFHNYSHTILSLSCGPGHPLVQLTRVLEQLFARSASAAFCVTKAMQADLAANWGIQATVLHDRPPSHFAPISVEEKHAFIHKLSAQYPVFKGRDEGSTVFTTVFTTSSGGQPSLLSHRPGLVVSSTSWTEDEDFSIFLEALTIYDSKVSSSELPNLICVITGKGDLKEFYLARIAEANLRHVSVITPWLHSADYPRMLASADLGVCLHTSSSGLDLPMKVVDMFGCGLPVAAVNFSCLDELVQDGVNGRVFTSGVELSAILMDWFAGFPSSSSTSHHLFRTNLAAFRQLGWHDNWRAAALPIFHQMVVMKENGGGSSGPAIVVFFICLFLALVSFLPTVQ